MKSRLDFDDFGHPGAFKRWMSRAFLVAGGLCLVGVLVCLCFDLWPRNRDGKPVKPAPAPVTVPAPDLNKPVCEAPAAFPKNSNLPRGRETLHSGAIDLKTFDAKRDLIRFEDQRCWFESDHDNGKDNEDDHLINRAMEIPLKRLVNLLEKKNAKARLKIQDCFRPANANRIHLENSLHCEGRAIDLTVENATLSDLAILCWQSGFDFVLYETPKNSGEHLHCSVKRLETAKPSTTPTK